MNTNYIFFTGKGGVGKTSLSCATAIHQADSGKQVLLVSTDPASNLQDVLESPIDETISAVKGVKGLFAVNINPEVSAAEYRKRATEPLKGLLPDAEIARMQEELSGACTVEIAAFDEFSRFISGESEGDRYDVIIFDTAPTGHTLRLLELPAAWTSFSEENPDGASCLGPSSALKSSQKRYHNVVDRLRDADLITFYLVARPDNASLKEASRTSDELKALGLAHQKLLLNGVFKALERKDPFALKIEEMATEQLENIPANLRSLDRQTYPLLPYNVMGVKKLRSLLDPGLQQMVIEERLQSTARIDGNMEGLNDLVDSISAGRDHGLIMTMGKGGVQK